MVDLRKLVIPKNVINQEGFATYVCTVTYTKPGTGEEQAKIKQKSSRITLTTIKKNSASAVSLFLYAPQGTVIQNGEREVEIVASAYEGVSDISESARFEWLTYSSGEWTVMENENRSTVVIPSEAIQSTAVIRCRMTYNEITYTQTIT